jgi:hypothetical protein
MAARNRDDDTRPRATARPGLGASRRRQLLADLALTPEERVRAADETLRLTLLRNPAAARVIGFDRYEDFLDWKRLDRLGL